MNYLKNNCLNFLKINKKNFILKKTAFNVELAKFDAATKIKVIKEVRTVLGLGLKEAKELVEKAPTVVK